MWRRQWLASGDGLCEDESGLKVVMVGVEESVAYRC